MFWRNRILIRKSTLASDIANGFLDDHMKRIVLVGLLLAGFGIASAQTPGDFQKDSLRRAYDRETIFVFGNGTRFAKGGRAYASGIRQKNLEREFEFSTAGLSEYKAYRKLRTISSILTVASLGTTIVGLTSVNNRGSNAYWAWWGAGIAIGLGNGVVSGQANNRLQQAVWIRNRDALTR